MDVDATEPRGTKRSAEDTEAAAKPKRIRVSSREHPKGLLNHFN
jgi:hypothetical protein